MKKDDALSYDPWQELASSRQVKKVSLADALAKLAVDEEEAPAVKRGMLNKVQKLAKEARAPKSKK
jgi:hypothetical protein